MDRGPETKWKLPAKLRDTVLEMVLPTPDELVEIDRASLEIVDIAGKVIEKIGLKNVKPMMAGSVAKGTMSKDPDLDLFVLFPEGTSRKEIEKQGMRIGKELLDDPKKKYTQHPYLTGRFREFKCDVVPCVSIERGSRIRTAVDRTPHHTGYINSRLEQDQKKEVLLLKSFLKTVGAYGAEDTVQGFSGYLIEILILFFQNFENVISFLSSIEIEVNAPYGSEEVQQTIHKGGPAGILLFDEKDLVMEQPLDERTYMKMFRNDPLIVVDPVDNRRNVASPISYQTLALVSNCAVELIDHPSMKFFDRTSFISSNSKDRPKEIEPGHHYFILGLPLGDPGIVTTQLRRSLRKLSDELFRKGFERTVIRFILRFPDHEDVEQGYLRARYTWRGSITEPEVLISIRTDPVILDREYIHWGPPVENKRLKDFEEKYGDRVKIDGPTKKAYVLLERDKTDAGEISLDIWRSIHHGSRFQDSILRPVEGGELIGELAGAFEDN